MGTTRHVLVPRHRAQRVSTVGLKATAEWLSFGSFATVVAHDSDEGWTSYRLSPGPYAHNLFVEGEAPSDTPAFTALVLAAGDTPRELALGEGADSVYFYLRIEGCAFDSVLDALSERLHQIMVVRTETFSAPT